MRAFRKRNFEKGLGNYLKKINICIQIAVCKSALSEVRMRMSRLKTIFNNNLLIMNTINS